MYVYDPNMYKSLSQLDTRHLLTFYSTYELPIGPGKAFGSGLSGVGEKVLGGWQVNGIVTLRTALP